MLDLLKRFVRQEEGLEMVEWAIVAVLITSAGAITMLGIGRNVDTRFIDVLMTLRRANLG
ncbi:MAG: hypothetical protein JRG92_17530 [Deltaproteobacteria bacterium]|jgi:Flp pilus assembly pilin Flp|nr:hypothetical protein [Deltaproteobacteria bacterium]MBW2385437.1 hypothetical protein [Deltaproteobacteria bacterium]MBW2696409.1 hypothetical protein [Deltaproteobacteria bacterium]